MSFELNRAGAFNNSYLGGHNHESNSCSSGSEIQRRVANTKTLVSVKTQPKSLTEKVEQAEKAEQKAHNSLEGRISQSDLDCVVSFLSTKDGLSFAATCKSQDKELAKRGLSIIDAPSRKLEIKRIKNELKEEGIDQPTEQEILDRYLEELWFNAHAIPEGPQFLKDKGITQKHGLLFDREKFKLLESFVKQRKEQILLLSIKPLIVFLRKQYTHDIKVAHKELKQWNERLNAFEKDKRKARLLEGIPPSLQKISKEIRKRILENFDIMRYVCKKMDSKELGRFLKRIEVLDRKATKFRKAVVNANPSFKGNPLFSKDGLVVTGIFPRILRNQLAKGKERIIINSNSVIHPFYKKFFEDREVCSPFTEEEIVFLPKGVKIISGKNPLGEKFQQIVDLVENRIHPPVAPAPPPPAVLPPTPQRSHCREVCEKVLEVLPEFILYTAGCVLSAAIILWRKE